LEKRGNSDKNANTQNHFKQKALWRKGEAMMDANTIAFNGKGLDVDTDGYLSQHDVVFLTPVAEGYDGIPLGNGDVGVMAWTPPDHLHFQINKCDTWDDAPRGSFGAWEDVQGKPESNENFTSLRSCGELKIVPGLPVFDWMYLTDFEARLSLAQARAAWSAEGPFGKIKCSAFVAADPKVIVINYEDELSEPVTRWVKLERWGSRVFEHWYHCIRRARLLGPDGTKAGAEKDEVWFEQPTRSLTYAVACKLIGQESPANLWHSRSAGFQLQTGKSCAFTLFLAAVTSEEADDPLTVSRDLVRQAAKQGEGAIFTKHKKYWSDFWSESFVDLSEDYLTNLWYIDLYQLGSSSRGSYPPHFISSLWSWNRDFKPWNHYYHWNQQQYTWPLLTSGHPELLLPYAKWRLEGLPQAIKDSQEAHNYQGAFYTDTCNRHGDQDINSPPRKLNLSPGAQIALDLYRHYEYTLDEEFLTTYTYPILREVVRFYLDYLKKENDGRYHIPKSNPYETLFLTCKDTTSDLAYIRKLFPVFSELAIKLDQDRDLGKRAADVVGKLADYVYAEIHQGADTYEDVPAGTPIIACGLYLHTGQPGDIWSKGPNGSKAGTHIGNAQMAPVYPTGLVGLDQKGSELFARLENFLRAVEPVGLCGHNLSTICLARMGLSGTLEKALADWVDSYQLFSQGLFCYFRRTYEDLYRAGLFGEPFSASDHLHPSITAKVEIVGSSPKEVIDFPKAPFAHMALEAGAVLQTTINEMLLQSHSGRIRVFPAIPETWEGRFKLHAMGGFVVTSEYKENDVMYIAIESKCGRRCKVVSPWPEAEKVQVKDIADNDKIVFSGAAEQLEFDTIAGHNYLIERLSKPVSSYRHEKISGEKNQAPKRLKNAMLGKTRQF